MTFLQDLASHFVAQGRTAQECGDQVQVTCQSGALNWRAFRFIQSEDKNTDEAEKSAKVKVPNQSKSLIPQGHGLT